jgi:hypothetical protein
MHIPIIVDAHSRRVSAMPMKHKDEALTHCVEYVRLMDS